MTTPAVQPTTEFSVFLPFSKVDSQPDGTVMVHSRINDETEDDQGEVVTFEAVQKASVPYLEWANVREMHNAETAAGTMVSLTPIPDERAHEAILHVVDPIAVQKVLAKVYKGTSLGGFKRRIALAKVDGGGTQRRVTEIDWRETSLVDRPSRPTAQLTLLKRSDGGDPPELIEEVDMGDEAPLAKATEAPAATEPAEGVSTPEAAPASTAAPEAGLDVHVGADGQPLAKVADAPAAAEPIADPTTTAATLPDVPQETLAKSAVDDVGDAGYIANVLGQLIETQALDGDSEDATTLGKALAIIQGWAVKKGTEIGTPADVEERTEEIAEMAASAPIPVIVVDALMAYSSKGGDLAKIGSLLEAALAKASSGTEPIGFWDGVAHERARPGVAQIPGVAQPTTPTEPAAVDIDELLAKTTTLIDERFARYVSRTDLEAMKVEVLGAFKPIEEGLAKIAKMPVPGGPARYALDTSRLDGGSPDPSSEVEVLSKAAQSATDPAVKEHLGRLAAAAEIKQSRSATG